MFLASLSGVVHTMAPFVGATGIENRGAAIIVCWGVAGVVRRTGT
jgi:hypothetical protein